MMAPNMIDFKSVWKKFAGITNNVAVLATVVVVLLIYAVVVVCLRRCVFPWLGWAGLDFNAQGQEISWESTCKRRGLRFSCAFIVEGDFLGGGLTNGPVYFGPCVALPHLEAVSFQWRWNTKRLLW